MNAPVTAVSDERPDVPAEAALVAIAGLPGVGPARLRWLVGLGDPEDVLDRIRRGRLPDPPGRLGLGRDDLHRWVAAGRAIDTAAAWGRVERSGVSLSVLGDDAYPQRLAEDTDPPAVLFHLGDPSVLAAPTVAIVGTRRASGYGRKVASDLGRDLAAIGISVVSGLALGIDVAAHLGATSVQASGARGAPVGVVAAGLDAPCPVKNRPTAEEVARRGALLSEVPPGVSAEPWRFPVRNRIVAALADALVVVESRATGGSMHTVREALDRDVPILAVPGPIHSDASEGTNQLLRDGAHPLLDIDDVLGAAGISANAVATPGRDPVVAVQGVAQAVLDEIGWTPVTVGQLAQSLQLELPRLSLALNDLERAGRVRRVDGWIERIG